RGLVKEIAGQVGEGIELLRMFGIPQAGLLGGQELTPEKVKETKDIPIPKDPLSLIGYFGARLLDPEKGFKKMKEVA
ncbi:MAG: hypothetical protein GWN17_00190, partial [Candidatus Korarchaeota archaeon]|nr:hypothetical protein [Candidatus Korarchaeota archaeon]